MHSFQKARITLTAWYVAILAIILFSFSFVLYTGEQRDFVRVIVHRDFNSSVPRVLSPSEQEDVNRQLVEIRRAFVINLVVVDGIVLLLGGALSYFLAGITLAPIKQTFMQQKEFLADVSHEIRTPLAAIQTVTEVSLRSSKKTKEDYKHVVEQVYDQSKRLTKMANDLLLLSRIESRATLSLKSISLSKIMSSTVIPYKTVAQTKQIQIKEFYDKNVFVIGDADSLAQLVIILLDNAVKYTPPGGMVTISVVSHPKPMIKITDTGLGISRENKEKIFERFYQADKSRSSAGNGLGLAIAQEIATANKAKIEVDSVPEKGSTFTVTFLG